MYTCGWEWPIDIDAIFLGNDNEERDIHIYMWVLYASHVHIVLTNTITHIRPISLSVFSTKKHRIRTYYNMKKYMTASPPSPILDNLKYRQCSHAVEVQLKYEMRSAPELGRADKNHCRITDLRELYHNIRILG